MVKRFNTHSENNDIFLKYVAYGVLGLVATVFLFSIIGNHPTEQSYHKTSTHYTSKNSRAHAFNEYQNINVKTQDESVNLQQHIRETDKNIVYEINGKHIEIDKNTLFAKECETSGDLETDSQTSTYMFTTYYIYLVRDFFIDWCNIIDTQKYTQTFDSVFGSKLTTYDDYLKQHFGKNYKKCAIDPLLKARKGYNFKRLDAIYTDALKDWTTKPQFCLNLRTDTVFMTKVFSNIKTEEIEYMEKQQINITIKSSSNNTTTPNISQTDQQKAALKADSYSFCKTTQEKALGGYVTSIQKSFIHDVCECISEVDVGLATKPLLDIYAKKGYDSYVLALDDRVAKRQTDECFYKTGKKYGFN